MRRRLVLTLGALAVAMAMAMGIPAAGAAGGPTRVPELHPLQQVHPCEAPSYQLKLWVWPGGSGTCRDAIAAGARVMWPANEAPRGVLKTAGL